MVRLPDRRSVVDSLLNNPPRELTDITCMTANTEGPASI